VLNQVLEGIAQLAQFSDLLIQLLDMLTGQGFDIGAGALAVLPQGPAACRLLPGKTQIPRALDKRQGVQIVVTVDPIAAVGAMGGLEQAD
jgi:hypothetical protein